MNKSCQLHLQHSPALPSSSTILVTITLWESFNGLVTSPSATTQWFLHYFSTQQPEWCFLNKLEQIILCLKFSNVFSSCVVCAKSLQPCPTFCNPMNCSPPGSSVREISQARILEWAVMPSSRGSSQPRDRTASPVAPALQADSSPLSHQEAHLFITSKLKSETSYLRLQGCACLGACVSLRASLTHLLPLCPVAKWPSFLFLPPLSFLCSGDTEPAILFT